MNRTLQTYIVITLVFVIGFYCSIKSIVAHEIRSAFQKYGLESIELSVDSAGFTNASLKNIIIGDKKELNIAKANLSYTLSGLWAGQIDSITLDSMLIEADTANGRLSLHGLDSAIRDNIPLSSPTILPAYFFEPAHFFFSSLTIKNGQVHVRGSTEMTIPFTLAIHKDGGYLIDFESTGRSGKWGGYSIAGSKISGALALSAKEKWTGLWKAEDIIVANAPDAPSVVSLSGSITADPLLFSLGMNIKSTPSLIDGTAEMQIRKQNASISLRKAHVFWAGGVIEANSIIIPLRNTSVFKFSVDLSHVGVASLFPLLAAQDASGTGFVSGELNVGITSDDKILFNNSLLKADGPGILSLPKQGKGLEAFHYKNMQITMDSKDNVTNMHVSATGNSEAKGAKTTRVEANLTSNPADMLKRMTGFYTSRKRFPRVKCIK